MYVIRDLGEMVVWRDGVIVDPGGTKPRTILALLCAHAGRPVPASTLIAEVWGADAPAKTQRALESQMWRLRKALVPEGFPPVIITERAGYRLDLDEVSVDSIDFETAGVAVLSGAVVDPSALDAVLSTWRGEPFTTAAPSPGLDQARRQLDVIRTALLTRRADLSAESGQYHRAIDEAQALVTRDPLDEHAWALKITVLAATGQRAEAFTAYRDVRELLATELGVTPGDEIRAAHRHALGQHNRSVRRLHLPSQHTSFVGRTSELAETVRLLESDRAVSLDGIPGVGKTRLALEAARRVADSFDDGVWFIDRSTDAGVAETVLTTMRIQPAADSTAGLDQVCDHLATMSVLLVLDGPMSSEDVDVVDAILQRCAAVTILGSSGPMGVRGERVLTVHPLTVDIGRTGGPSPAQQLLVDRIRVARGVFDPDPADLDDLDRICTAMGGLPLGLELAAARWRRSRCGKWPTNSEVRSPSRSTALSGWPTSPWMSAWRAGISASPLCAVRSPRSWPKPCAAPTSPMIWLNSVADHCCGPSVETDSGRPDSPFSTRSPSTLEDSTDQLHSRRYDDETTQSPRYWPRLRCTAPCRRRETSPALTMMSPRCSPFSSPS
ncbi:BTAD domain-containing putative transcriptional regulator [Gordonia sp. i37]|uniref:AfsR/SARP family transcriptional regulator n=1 Tax=Gordonia sp. i37 TaxID=1961707 RepID=UPI00209A8E02|nr:BTAD domain-containing putative transcriptional regulator [Gordonia sp. i37]